MKILGIALLTHLVFLAEVQAKKVFTVEEKAMRRAEMARRRRNLSEKRNEEVKVCYTLLDTTHACRIHTQANFAPPPPSTARNDQQTPQKASHQDQSQGPERYRRGGRRRRGWGRQEAQPNLHPLDQQPRGQLHRRPLGDHTGSRGSGFCEPAAAGAWDWFWRAAEYGRGGFLGWMMKCGI